MFVKRLESNQFRIIMIKTCQSRQRRGFRFFEPRLDPSYDAAEARIEDLRFTTWDSSLQCQTSTQNRQECLEENENICVNEGFRHTFDGSKEPGFRGCGIPQLNDKNEQFCAIHHRKGSIKFQNFF